MFWTAEALFECYRITKDKRYLRYGQQTLDKMLMTQASWQPPYMNVNVLGGFGVMNSDVEWNDARGITVTMEEQVLKVLGWENLLFTIGVLESPLKLIIVFWINLERLKDFKMI